MKRDDIHIISRNSNWSKNGVETVLKAEIYSDATAWKKFVHILLISLGVGFSVSGIIFFFAYNWADLHKFVKIGMVEGLIAILTLFIVFSKLNLNIKNIILTGTSVLVGVMIAVFGQIYQTGANAYDFFLGWTAFITIWVVISNYAPLWLVYIVLLNTSFMLYSEQVAPNWSGVFILTILFLSNTILLAISLYIPKIRKEAIIPIWFTIILALASVFFATSGVVVGIAEDKHNLSFLALIILAIAIYLAGFFYGLRIKSGFYLSVIPFSVIIIFSAILIKISSGATMFFIVSIFIISSVTLLIKSLMDIQKKWNNE